MNVRSGQNLVWQSGAVSVSWRVGNFTGIHCNRSPAMKKLLVPSCVALLFAAVPASAQDNFPFVKSLATLDLATPDGLTQFETTVGNLRQTPMVYLDWHLAGFGANEVFAELAPDLDGEDADAAACERLAAPEPVGTLSGKANPDNNHLLLTIQLPQGDAVPFASSQCEFFSPTVTPHAVRLRGFYHVTDIRTATADHFGLRPLDVEPSAVPRDFFAQ